MVQKMPVAIKVNITSKVKSKKSEHITGRFHIDSYEFSLSARISENDQKTCFGQNLWQENSLQINMLQMNLLAKSENKHKSEKSKLPLRYIYI